MNTQDVVTTLQHYSQQMTAPIRTDHKWIYYRIKLLSAYCIILGLASIIVQIAVLVMYATSLYKYPSFETSVVSQGIWAGSFYVVSGSLGIASAHKRTQSLLVLTVVFSSLSIACSIFASTLSGLAASYSYCPGHSLCQSWLALQWYLLGISILASISSITLLVLTSIPLCCSGRNENPIGYQQMVDDVWPGMGQHPIYFHHQPMQLSAQQLYQPNFQASYAVNSSQTAARPPPSPPPPYSTSVSPITTNEICSSISTCPAYTQTPLPLDSVTVPQQKSPTSETQIVDPNI